MIVYRITGKAHAYDLSGLGAALFGGRWNKKGAFVLYTGENIEIALLEAIVHIPPLMVPDLVLITLEIPDNSITEFKTDILPKNWADYPAPTVLSEMAEKWIKAEKSIALIVPGCIVQTSHNIILNCKHPDFNKVKRVDQRDFQLDTRLRK